MSKGVTTVFGYQGGSITHMIDSFDKYGIRYIQSYNEQGAGLAADAYARVSKLGLGVAIGTNGPGATNLITAIANAYCDSVPVLFFTGQVHSFAMKKSADVRQESFQEIDILPMVKPVTKYAVTVMDKSAVITEIDKAIKIAMEGRKGPVVIDLPVDVQGQDVDYELRKYEAQIQDNTHSKLNIKSIIDRLYTAVRPLVIAGGGIRTSHAANDFRKLIKMLDIPVVTSLMGLDVLPHNDANFVGYIGSYGNRYANYAVQNADLILIIGSRLDMRQTGKRKDLFAPNAVIIHVDIDAAELGHFINEDIQIKCDIRQLIKSLISSAQNIDLPDITEWRDQIAEWKLKYPSHAEFNEMRELNPNLYLKLIGEQIGNHAVVACDVGQNQMWAGQSLRISGDDIRILNSGGLGAMGYSLPACIGAYFANKDRKAVAIMGDGGLQMNIQELQMVAHYRIPCKIIVLKNNALGLIRDTHEKYYDKRYVGSVDGFSVPPLDRIAEAYNLRYKRISNYNDCLNLKEIIEDDCAWMIEVELKGNTYTRPELLGPDGLDRQSPYVEGMS